MIDTDKYEGHSKGPWEYNNDDDGWTLAAIRERDDSDRDEWIVLMTKPNGDPYLTMNPDLKLIANAPLLLEEVKRLRKGIRSILSDYDITELIRDVPQDEWNFEQQALIRMKELIE